MRQPQQPKRPRPLQPQSEDRAPRDSVDGRTPSTRATSGHTPSGRTPSGHTPSGRTPSGHTPSGRTPSGHTPSGHTPSDPVRSDDTPVHTPDFADIVESDDAVVPPSSETRASRLAGLRQRLSRRRTQESDGSDDATSDASEWSSGAVSDEADARSYVDLRAESNAPVQMSERRAEKKREQRTVRLRRVGVGLGLIVVLLLVVWLLFKSPIFRYSYDSADLTIEEPGGVINVDNAQTALASHDGVQLLSLNLNGLASDLKREVPEIKSVSIKRDLPSGLTVTLTPHTPVACLGSGESCQPVAEDGTDLRLGPTVKSRLPVVNVSGNDDVERAVRTALDVLGSLEPEVHSQVNGVTVSDAGLVTLALTEGRSVFWGASEDNDLKARVLTPLLTQPAKTYDISIPLSPVTS